MRTSTFTLDETRFKSPFFHELKEMGLHIWGFLEMANPELGVGPNLVFADSFEDIEKLQHYARENKNWSATAFPMLNPYHPDYEHARDKLYGHILDEEGE